VRVAAIAVVAAIGCGKSPTIVARLDEAVAQVERMPEAGATWESAHPGDTFVIGSAVRTGRASTARLTIGSNGKLALDPASIVYFRTSLGKDRRELRVDTGRVVLETGDEPVAIGDAVLESGGRARIERGERGTTLVVEIGRMTIEDSSTMTAGDQITLDDRGKRVAITKPAPPAPVAHRRGALVVRVTGKPVRATGPGGDATLDPGEHDLDPQTRLAAPDGSAVDISRDDAHLVVSGPGEVELGGPPEMLATVSAGGVVLRSHRPATVAVPGGAIAVGDGEASAQVDREGSTIASRRGSTTVRSKRSEKVLSPGELATLSANGAILVLPPPPKHSVLAISAGESPVIHDLGAPTAIRVALGDDCPSALVEVARDRRFQRPVARSSGTGSANVLVPAGSYHYRVRCDGGRLRTGTLRVVRDSGRAPLPKVAARTLVEMDGREYTILYQNLLPELTLSWRAAAFSVGYTFVVKSASGAERRFQSPTSKVILKPGTVGEGRYTVWAEPSGSARSESSRIVLEFDNATPTVQLDTIDRDGDHVIVKGSVLDGSTVSIGGTAIELDRHRRFSAAIPPANDAGIGVRIAHPKLGVHYYVVTRGR